MTKINMPNTKQPEQNKDWRERFDLNKNKFAFDSDDGFILGENGIVYDMDRIKSFIQEEINNLLKEQLERVNKEVIGETEKPLDMKWKGHKIVVVNTRNLFRTEQRQKLEEIKNE